MAGGADFCFLLFKVISIRSFHLLKEMTSPAWQFVYAGFLPAWLCLSPPGRLVPLNHPAWFSFALLWLFCSYREAFRLAPSYHSFSFSLNAIKKFWVSENYHCVVIHALLCLKWAGHNRVDVDRLRTLCYCCQLLFLANLWSFGQLRLKLTWFPEQGSDFSVRVLILFKTSMSIKIKVLSKKRDRRKYESNAEKTTEK